MAKLQMVISSWMIPLVSQGELGFQVKRPTVEFREVLCLWQVSIRDCKWHDICGGKESATATFSLQIEHPFIFIIIIIIINFPVISPIYNSGRSERERKSPSRRLDIFSNERKKKKALHTLCDCMSHT